MNGLVILTVISIVIQFIIERVKVLLPQENRAIIPLIAMAVGIALSWSTGVGLFFALGIPLEPMFVDYIITGVAFSGGSVAFNELLKLVIASRAAVCGPQSQATEVRPGNIN